MASLICSPPSLSCGSSVRFPCFSSNEPASRLLVHNGIRCNLAEPLKLQNGKPCIPVINNKGSIPSFLTSMHLQSPINKNDTRLLIFSGAANLALSQEMACYMGLELGKI